MTGVNAQVYADFENILPIEENSIIWGASANGIATNPLVDEVEWEC